MSFLVPALVLCVGVVVFVLWLRARVLPVSALAAFASACRISWAARPDLLPPLPPACVAGRGQQRDAANTTTKRHVQRGGSAASSVTAHVQVAYESDSLTAAAPPAPVVSEEGHVILLTGASGFVGRYVVDYLCSPANTTLPVGCLLACDAARPCYSHPRILNLVLDVTAAADVAAVCARYRPTIVLHLAAIVDTRGRYSSVAPPPLVGGRGVNMTGSSYAARMAQRLFRVNVGGAHAVADAWAALTAEAERASSSAPTSSSFSASSSSRSTKTSRNGIVTNSINHTTTAQRRRCCVLLSSAACDVPGDSAYAHSKLAAEAAICAVGGVALRVPKVYAP